MTKDEALDLALEALIYASSYCDTYDAITAIKQARSAPVQEPDEWPTGCPECGMDSGCDCDSGTWNPTAAPVQEPVAWGCNRYIEDDNGFQIGTDEPELTWGKYAPDDNGWWPLYTTPPAAQRQWVGLTDEQRTQIRREHYARTLPLMDAVEAALKQNNT